MFAAKDRTPQDPAVSSRPITLAAPARISSKLRQESQTPPFLLAAARPGAVSSLPAVTTPLAVASPITFSPNCSRPQEPRRRRVSTLRALLPAQKFQHAYFHLLPHSLQQ